MTLNSLKAARKCVFARHRPTWLFAVVTVLIVACAPTNGVPEAPTMPVASEQTRQPTAEPIVVFIQTPTASPTQTPLPAATLAPTATPRPTATATPKPLPPKVTLNLTHDYQKWNNCGPVSLAVVTTFFGIARDQFQIAEAVKGGEKDRNVSPAEMQAYLQGVGLRAIVRVNGTQDVIMRLLAAGVPVIMHQWLLKSNGELVGHYRVAQGYDLGTGVFITSDPFTPPRKAYTFAEFERFWYPWNHRYMVAYKPEQEAAVRAALGEDFDVAKNIRRALADTTAAVSRNARSAEAWFNLGDNRLATNDARGAVEAYDKASALGLPAHFAWYNFGPFEALYKTGSYQSILDMSAPMLKEASTIEEIRFWRGKAFLALGQKDKARTELVTAVQLNARYTEAKALLAELK